MTDREKQIEEMARVIEYCAHKDCESCKQQGNFRCSAYNHALDLYNAGYRKMDEVTLKLDLGDRTPEEIKQIAEQFKSVVSDKPIMAIPTSKEVEELCKKAMCEELKSLQRVFNGRAKEYTNWDGNKVQAVTLDWINADIDETIADIINGESE